MCKRKTRKDPHLQQEAPSLRLQPRPLGTPSLARLLQCSDARVPHEQLRRLNLYYFHVFFYYYRNVFT